MLSETPGVQDGGADSGDMKLDGFRRTYRRDIAGARFAGHGKSEGGWASR